MARRVNAPRRRWVPAAIAAGAVAVVVIVALVGAMVIFGGKRPDPSSPPHPTPSSVPSHGAPASPAPGATARPTTPPQATPTTTQSPSTLPPTEAPGSTSPSTATPAPNAAPTSAADFDLQGQVIDIGFPLRADTDYHYRDNYLERRDGTPDPYNHARVETDGTLVRLHDGIDIYAPESEPVLAPFDGVVIDPATKWTPWEPDRYGLTVVVESDEPTSVGYTAVLVHLDKVWVATGQHVSRGQVIGVLGRTGNAENVKPQLHFELRAPFLIDWSSLGEDREVDAFNPYPSLVAADPNT